MATIDWIKREYPLHYLVWNDSHTELAEELAKNEHDVELRDNRRRTPLMLAVMLGHVECVRALLAVGADASHESSDGWTVVQEAVATGDPELVRSVLERRDYQRYTSRMAGIPELLNRLNQAPDFYVEMRWEFTSWLPLVSRMCPSDTYKVYKQGANVRIDTTLLGFDQSSWQRGSRSYIFRGAADGATVMEIDHDTRHVYVERMRVAPPDEVRGTLAPATRDSVAHRLAAPIVTTYVDTDKISFERNKAGLWGWRSDKSEAVAGHECKVFSASNVELVTKTRTEHLATAEKARARPARTPLHSFLGIAETVADVDTDPDNSGESPTRTPSPTPSPHLPQHDGNPWELTAEEYFGSDSTSGQMRDIGRPREINTKVQKFRATLWLSERYPLSLQEQIMPVVDLMAISSSHFAKLKDFIQMQLPAGFPVKIEIPLFHVLNARITFGNIFALDSSVPHVFTIKEEVPSTDGAMEERVTCVVDDGCFEPPAGYARPTDGIEPRRQFSVEEEDELLQFAIQQSLVEAGTEKDEVDIWEALKAQRPSRPTTPGSTLAGEEERQLQRAIQASLALYRRADDPPDGLAAEEPTAMPATPGVEEEEEDPELRMALMLSEQQRREEDERRMHEQRVLEEILRLSLTEK